MLKAFKKFKVSTFCILSVVSVTLAMSSCSTKEDDIKMYSENCKISSFLNLKSNGYRYFARLSNGDFYRFEDDKTLIINELRNFPPEEISAEEYNKRLDDESVIDDQIRYIDIKKDDYTQLTIFSDYTRCIIDSSNPARFSYSWEHYIRFYLLGENVGKRIFKIAEDKVTEEKNKPF